MGNEWLTEICGILEEAGIPAGNGFPGSVRKETGQAVAAVGLRNLDYGSGEAVFEIRVVSPRHLGGLHCQTRAADAVAALENKEIRCAIEPMGFDSRQDCFAVLILGRWRVLESRIQVKIGSQPVYGVTEFTAELNRGRRVIDNAWGQEPVGVTPGRTLWNIRMVQTVGKGRNVYGMPEEPFSLLIKEHGLWTIYGSCCWNRVERRARPEGMTVIWEGFAMERKEPVDGLSEVQEL